MLTFKLEANPILCREYCGQHPSPPQKLGRESIAVNISHFRNPHLQVVSAGDRSPGLAGINTGPLDGFLGSPAKGSLSVQCVSSSVSRVNTMRNSRWAKGSDIFGDLSC